MGSSTPSLLGRWRRRERCCEEYHSNRRVLALGPGRTESLLLAEWTSGGAWPVPASEVAARSEGAHQPSQAIAAAGSCGSAPIFSWRPRILLCPPQAGPLTPAALCSLQDPFPAGDPAAGTQPTGLPQPSDRPTGPPQPSDQLPCLVPGFSASRAQALPWVPKPECVPHRRPLSRVRWAALAAVLAVHCHIPVGPRCCAR